MIGDLGFLLRVPLAALHAFNDLAVLLHVLLLSRSEHPTPPAPSSCPALSSVSPELPTQPGRPLAKILSYGLPKAAGWPFLSPTCSLFRCARIISDAGARTSSGAMRDKALKRLWSSSFASS